MSRQILTLTVALAFLQASGADDVTVDVSKLTAFTTTFSFKAKDLLEDLQQSGSQVASDAPLFASDLIVQGKIIANVPGEKMKIALDLSGHLPLKGPGSPESPLKDTFVLTFDGPKGFVAAEDTASAADTPDGDLSATACVKDKFDSRMIPRPEQVKAMIDQQAAMVSAMANQMPHAVRDDLAYYVFLAPNRLSIVVLALHVADGTPAAFWLLEGQRGAALPDPESAADTVQSLPPWIKFGDFVEAEHFPEVQCVSSASNTEMLEQPRSKIALLLAEQLLKRLQLAGPLAPVTGHVFGQLPQVLRNTGKSCILPAEAAIQTAAPVQPLGFFGIAAACMVSAAAGAGIAVSAVRRAFGKEESVYLEIS